MIKFAILSISMASTLAFAEPKAMPLEVPGMDNPSISAASVQEQVTLIQSEKGGSDLRVSFLVTDNGGSTDVSPKASLYLTTFNQSEMKDAQSAHLITPINELVSSKRIEAGVYEAVVRLYDFDSVCTSWNGEIEGLMSVRIDAKQLTVDVRSFKGVEEFGMGTIQTPVKIEYTCM